MVDIFTIDPKDMEILEGQDIKTNDPATVLKIANETDMEILWNFPGIETIYKSMGIDSDRNTIKTDLENAIIQGVDVATEGAVREYLKIIYEGAPKKKPAPQEETTGKKFTFQKSAATSKLIEEATALLTAYENLYPGKLDLVQKRMEKEAAGVDHDAD